MQNELRSRVSGVRGQSRVKSCCESSLPQLISRWRSAHPEVKQKSVHDCIDDIHAEKGRPPTTDELYSRISEVRGQSHEKSCCESSLSQSISRWRSAHPEVKPKYVHDCIDDIYAGKGRPPTTDELSSRVSEVRGRSNEKSCCQSSLSKSISVWKRAHPEVKQKSVHDYIDDIYAEKGDRI